MMLRAAAEVQPMTPSPSASPQAPARILIVEDHPETLTAYQFGLGRAFPGLLTAPDGLTALTLLEQYTDIGVVLADQRMPGMYGDALLQQIGRQAPHIIRILYTAYHDEDLEARVVQTGIAHDYLRKPIGPPGLEVVLRSALARYERGVTACDGACPDSCDDCPFEVDAETEAELTDLRRALAELTADERGP